MRSLIVEARRIVSATPAAEIRIANAIVTAIEANNIKLNSLLIYRLFRHFNLDNKTRRRLVTLIKVLHLLRPLAALVSPLS